MSTQSGNWTQIKNNFAELPNRLTAWRRLSPSKQREAKWGLLFISPWIVGFLLFSVIPLAAALVFSFTNFDLLHPADMRFIGLDNYRRMMHDRTAWRSLTVTTTYVLLWTPISVLAPLGIATLLHAKQLIGSRFFRLLFYVPTLIPNVAVGFIINGFFSERGWFYQLFLAPYGVTWVETGTFYSSFLSLVILNTSLWGVGNIILILLAAKQGIPVDLYEAAKVDGACPICTFFAITLPSISPVLFYSLVISLISSFQYFAAPYLMGGAIYDPNNPALFFTVYLVQRMTIFHEMGYGSTLGFLFLALVAIVSLVVFGSSRFWVFYADE